MKYLIICLVSSLGFSLFAQAPELAEISLDSATNWLSEHVGDPGDTALVFGMAVLQKARQEGDDIQAAYASREIAYWHYLHVESEIQDSILKYDRMAFDLFTTGGQVIESARSAGHVSTALSDKNNFLGAEEILFKAIKQVEPTQNTTLLASLYANLSFIYRNAKDYESAITYGQRSVDLYLSLTGEDTLQAMVPLFYLVPAYIFSDRPEEGLKIAERSIKMVALGGGEELVGETLRAYGFRALALQNLGRLDEAMQDYRYTYELAKKHVPEEQMADGHKEGIGTILHLKGQHRQAVTYLEDYSRHLVERGIQNDPSLIPVYQMLAESYSKIGDPEKALAYKDSAYFYNNNRLSSELQATRSELRVRYATAEKDELIGEQEDTISRQSRTQQLSFGIGGLLLLGALGLFFGMRSNRRKNLLLEERNQENELLLKEIHHRVKNNLEVVSSLLELQSAGLEDEGAKEAMLASRSRVKSMGILHQKLYQGKSLKSIGMPEYFEQLASSLLNTYNEKERLTIEVTAVEVDMDVDTAIPLGLIVNELLTNAIKYAYAAEQKGLIKVELTRVNQKKYKLTVSDQGQGNATGALQGTGFGSRLVDLLGRQLDAEVQQRKTDGFRTEIGFAYPPELG